MNKQSVCLEDVMPLIAEKLALGQSVEYAPRGISMRPMLWQGRDTVMLSPLPDKLKKYDLPLYQRDNGKFVLHRIVKVGDTFSCIGDNQYSVEHGVEMRHMKAVVTAFKHNGKTYSVDSLGYRFYCRFWHYTRPLRHVFVWFSLRLRKLFGRG